MSHLSRSAGELRLSGRGDADLTLMALTQRAEHAPVRPPVIAIFDDDITYIRAVERMLRLAGLAACPVTTFDIDEAARVIAASRCRAVLVDIFLYDKPRGFACIERLRALEATADLPLLVTSGATRQLQRMAPFLDANRCELLAKPFGPDELLAKLHLATSRATGRTLTGI